MLKQNISMCKPDVNLKGTNVYALRCHKEIIKDVNPEK